MIFPTPCVQDARSRNTHPLLVQVDAQKSKVAAISKAMREAEAAWMRRAKVYHAQFGCADGTPVMIVSSGRHPSSLLTTSPTKYGSSKSRYAGERIVVRPQRA